MLATSTPTEDCSREEQPAEQADAVATRQQRLCGETIPIALGAS